MHSWFEQDETQGQAPIRECCLPACFRQLIMYHVLSKKEVLLNMDLLSNNRIRIWRLQSSAFQNPGN